MRGLPGKHKQLWQRARDKGRDDARLGIMYVDNPYYWNRERAAWRVGWEAYHREAKREATCLKRQKS